MRLFFEGEELMASSNAEVHLQADRMIVRTESGSQSAVAIRDGDAILVSYLGHQYHLETKRSRAASGGAAASGEYRAPMPGQIVDVLVNVGDTVLKGQKLIVLEAMKTQQPFNAPFDGTISAMNATKGGQVKDGDLLIVVVPNEEGS